MMSLKSAINIFVNEKECTVSSERTVQYYSNSLRYFSDYVCKERNKDINEIDINELTHIEYQEFVKMLKHRDKLSTHPLKPTVKKPITNTSIHTYGGAIRTFFNWLYENDFIENDVGKRIKLVKPEKNVIIPLFSDEIRAMDLAYNEKCATGLRNLIIIHLMLDMGFRVGDVCNLEIGHIYFDKRFIHVNMGKGNKDRIVPLPVLLKKWLYKYIYFYRADCNNDIVLQNKDGSPITYDTIKNIVSRLKKKVEIPRLKPHLLRHTFATCFCVLGGNIELLRTYLGHEDIKITQVYVRMANTYRLMAGNNVYLLDRIYFKNYYDTLIYQK